MVMVRIFLLVGIICLLICIIVVVVYMSSTWFAEVFVGRVCVCFKLISQFLYCADGIIFPRNKLAMNSWDNVGYVMPSKLHVDK